MFRFSDVPHAAGWDRADGIAVEAPVTVLAYACELPTRGGEAPVRYGLFLTRNYPAHCGKPTSSSADSRIVTYFVVALR